MPIVGIHQQYQGDTATTVAETLAEYPLTQATREFTANPIVPQNLIPRVEKLCRKVWDEDLIAVWSFKPMPSEVKNGKWKAHIQQLASYIKLNGLSNKLIITLWHEPENDVPKWFKSAVDYVSMFNTVHDWIKLVNPDLLTNHAALGYRYGDKNMGTVWTPRWEPIDIDDNMAKRWKTKADINSLDLYQGRSWPLHQILPENSAFKRWHTHLVGGPGNPFAVSERGFIADPAVPAQLKLRVDTIRREADWFATDPVGREATLILLWDTIGTEGDEFIPIRDEEGKEAVRYFMSRVNPIVEPQIPEPAPEPGTTDCPLCRGVGRVESGKTYTIVSVTQP